MKILCMTHPSARAVRNIPELKEQKLLGTGQFGAVFEGYSSDTVLKLTCDPTSYWMFNDGVVGCHGQHFPKTHFSFGDVGEVIIHANLRAGRPRLVPVYLYEQERLEPLRLKTEQRYMAAKLIKQADALRSTAPRQKSRIRDVDAAKHVLRGMAQDGQFCESISGALADMAEFCEYNDDLFLDMHFQNFMVRPGTGDLVFSDPVGCSSIWNSHRNYDVFS